MLIQVLNVLFLYMHRLLRVNRYACVEDDMVKGEQENLAMIICKC